jgi:hypothetical protein
MEISSFTVKCPHCSNEIEIDDLENQYVDCYDCNKTFEIYNKETIPTRSKFRYKNGRPIQFFECDVCHEIITGCMHHAVEQCKCGDFVDQEDAYCRMEGEFINVTNTLDNEEKRKIFTKTLFNYNKISEDYIVNELNSPRFIPEMFDVKYYVELYNEWKENGKQ